MTSDPRPEELWRPSPQDVERSNLTAFRRWLEAERGRRFDGYDAMWRWSTEDLEGFWGAVWDFYEVASPTPYGRVLDRAEMPGARWFAGAHVNFAEHALRPGADDDVAIVAVGEDAEPIEITRGRLRRDVAALAASLRGLGVEPGDRAAAYLPNSPQAVVAVLACASIGAVWTACAPDFGTQSVIDRFAQTEPKVLLAADGYRFGGKWRDRTREVAELRAALPSVGTTVMVGEPLDGTVAWDALVRADAEARFEPVPFDHPLWVLFSSGTTGMPKGIVHGHGGIVLEHLKSSGLQTDVRAGDVFYFFTSTSWMVWNMHVATLMHGATIVLYDGSPGYPDVLGSWRIAERTGADVLGTGAAYVAQCEKAGVRPGDELDLTRLRHIVTTGSTLAPHSWRWVYDAVKPDVWLDSASGGTDVCTGFVGGAPGIPVYAGRMQRRWLGCAVEAFSEDGRPLVEEVGELVITKPMPSMPLCFWNDPDGSRYREAYFDRFPGVWRHGDWITIHADETVEISGRSDSTLNKMGVRMGSADIYAIVEPLPGVSDSVVLGVEQPDGGYWMPLFVVPAEGREVDEDLRAQVVAAIRTRLSPRHVPDEIIAAPAVPRTLTGKKLEVPLKRLMQGAALEDVANLGAIDRPDAMRWFAEFAAGRS